MAGNNAIKIRYDDWKGKKLNNIMPYTTWKYNGNKLYQFLLIFLFNIKDNFFLKSTAYHCCSVKLS